MLKAVFRPNRAEKMVCGLTQWDKGRTLEIVAEDAPETYQVHFAYKNSKEAYVLEAVENKVNIPNILLMQSGIIMAWIYILNGDRGETIKAVILPVEPRTKPADYVYEETEVLSYTTLSKRIQELESTLDKKILDAIEAYFQANPIEGMTEEQKAQLAKNTEDITAQDVALKKLDADKADKEHTHSWNDLDDKPFGEESLVIVEEQTIDGFSVMQEPICAVGVENFMPFPSAGNSYVVTWDGVDYNVTAKEDPYEEIIYIGNDNYVTFTSGGNIPFAIIFAPDGNVFIATEPTDSSHTIGVRMPVVRQLDTKYLPKHLQFGEIPEIWTEAELIDDTSDLATCKLSSTPIEWTKDKSYRVRIDGIEYAFDGMSITNGSSATQNEDVYYIGADYIARNSNMDFSEYPFCLMTTDFANIYVVFADASLEHKVDFFISEGEVKQIDEKFIPHHKHNWNDLEDKPFGASEPIWTEFIPETTFSVSPNPDEPVTYIELGFYKPFTLYNEYKLIVNNETYHFIVDKQFMYFYGNGFLIDSESFADNGMDFCLVDDGDKNESYILLAVKTPEVDTEYTISVIEGSVEITKLDNKYAPSTMTSVRDYSTNEMLNLLYVDPEDTRSENVVYRNIEGKLYCRIPERLLLAVPGIRDSVDLTELPSVVGETIQIETSRSVIFNKLHEESAYSKGVYVECITIVSSNHVFKANIPTQIHYTTDDMFILKSIYIDNNAMYIIEKRQTGAVREQDTPYKITVTRIL